MTVSVTDPMRPADTVGGVPEPRDIAQTDAQRIIDAIEARDAAQLAVEKAVADALNHGASIRAVQAATGLSPNTIQKYGAKFSKNRPRRR